MIETLESKTPSDAAACSPLDAALLCVQKIEGVHEDDQFSEERHLVTLAAEIERLESSLAEARREAERWRDSMRSGMVMQSNPPSLIFDWENDKDETPL